MAAYSSLADDEGQLVTFPASGPRVLHSPGVLSPPPLSQFPLRITVGQGPGEGGGGGGSATARPGSALRPPAANGEGRHGNRGQKNYLRDSSGARRSARAQADLPTGIGLPRGVGVAQREPPISPSCPRGHVGEGKVKLL